MTNSLKLVTGASGKTGKYVVEELRKLDLNVRAMVRKEDERSNALKDLGAEIVVGDLLDLNQVRAALEGVDGAYFVFPIDRGLIEATAFFAQAAKEAGVKAVVNMSQISARRDSESHAARDHWIGERIFDWSGLNVTHLRPTFFAEWLTQPITLPAILERGVIDLPFADGRHAPIAARDQARIIAAILANPEPHAGKTYPLVGPVELSQKEIASEMSRVLGRKIEYKPTTIEQFHDKLAAISFFPLVLKQHLPAVAIDYRNGLFSGTNSLIEDITGYPPMTLEAFILENRHKFENHQAKS